MNNLFYNELLRAEAFMGGHFLLRSGKHSPVFINKDRALMNAHVWTTILEQWYKQVELWKPKGLLVDCVTGPAVAGITWAAPLAKDLMVPVVYPEKKIVDGEERMVFRQHFQDFLKKKNVLVVEDIVTTGGSLMNTIYAVEKAGGIVSGILVIVNREGWKPVNDACFFDVLVDMETPAYEPDECPLCKEGNVLLDPKTLEPVEV